jgi:subtilase family serine protease
MRRCAVVLAAAALPAVCGFAGAAQGRVSGLQIVQPIDDHVRVALVGNTRPEARNPKNDRGAVPGGLRLDHIFLQLRHPPSSDHRLERLIEQLYDMRSRNYHHWLTASEFGHEFGPARGDVEKVIGWLKSNGFTVNAAHANDMVIDFSGTAGQIARVFSTPIHYLNVKGVKHIANMRDPQIPAALSPAVAGIVSLNDFRPQTMNRQRAKTPFKTDSSGNGAVLPGDLAKIYNFNPLFSAGISGKGQTIAVVEDSNLYAAADWTRFRAAFGLTAYASGSLVTVHPNTGSSHGDCRDPGAGADDVEAAIDAEYASAGAPGARIEVASCANSTTTSGALIALQNLVNSASPPPVVSVSYGECETYLGAAGNAAYDAIYQQAAVEGVSVFAAAGNDGAAGCDAGQWVSFQGIAVNGMASTPYNVAVGGTDFADSVLRQNIAYWTPSSGNASVSALSYVPEIAWNDTCASAQAVAFLKGSPATRVPNQFCNTNEGSGFWTTTAGSGGPSACAYGGSDPNSAAAVSGTCSGYTKPSWQTGVTSIPDDGVRDIPDVSLFAGDGAWSHFYVYCWSDQRLGGASCANPPSNWSAGGGTSFATPLMAAVQALIDEKTGARQGNPASAYYALAAREYGGADNTACTSTFGSAAAQSCVFYDVTLGDMSTNCTSAQDLGFTFADYDGPVDCYMGGAFMGVLSTSNSADQPAFGAAPGWDFATGIGTVNVANLVNAWP